MPIMDMLEKIQRSNKLIRFTAWKKLPPSEPQWEDFPDNLHPELKFALEQKGIRRLYRHQAESFHWWSQNRNPVIATPTASGKTLCYNLPVLNDIIHNPGHRALYLFPTKALAQDQQTELSEISRLCMGRFKLATYDGDTPSDARKSIRLECNIVLTNPDMLHTGILPHHSKWHFFLQNLRTIVIDELHHYRGVFGSHLCNVLRRLIRICAFYQAKPTYILCSATLANPQELASQMIGQDTVLISNSGAPSGDKDFLFFNPPIIDETTMVRRSYLAETVDFAQICLESDVQTIIFTRNRRNVEILLQEIKHRMKGSEMEGTIRGYRGGYLTEERREIERGLKSGEIRCVISTSALELGIDIGKLEVSIISGYPGTIASTWQRAGRAGRRDHRSAAIYIASSTPLDQFIVRNPDYFFGNSPEYGLVNPDHLLILLHHIRCAAFELPFQSDELYAGNPSTTDILNYLGEAGDVTGTQNQWFYTGGQYPADQVNLRAISSESFLVIEQNCDKSTVIAQVDEASAPSLLHPQAIYLHEGKQYLVQSMDWESHRVLVQAIQSYYYTIPLEHASVRITQILQNSQKNIPIIYGELQVASHIVGFKKLRFHTMENLGNGQVSLPQQELLTTGIWFTFPMEHLLKNKDCMFQDAAAGVVGALSAMHSIASVMLMCDPHDLGTCVNSSSGNWSAQMDHLGMVNITVYADILESQPSAQLFIYDKYPGGIGLSESLFERTQELVSSAIQLVTQCECRVGCPGCVGPVNVSGSSLKSIALQVLYHFTPNDQRELGCSDIPHF